MTEPCGISGDSINGVPVRSKVYPAQYVSHRALIASAVTCLRFQRGREQRDRHVTVSLELLLAARYFGMVQLVPVAALYDLASFWFGMELDTPLLSRGYAAVLAELLLHTPLVASGVGRRYAAVSIHAWLSEPFRAGAYEQIENPSSVTPTTGVAALSDWMQGMVLRLGSPTFDVSVPERARILDACALIGAAAQARRDATPPDMYEAANGRYMATEVRALDPLVRRARNGWI